MAVTVVSIASIAISNASLIRSMCPPEVGKNSRGCGPTSALAVVVTIMVVVMGPDPLGVTELGEIMHAAPWGAPLQVKFTA